MQDRFEEFLEHFGKAYENHIHTEADNDNLEEGIYEPSPQARERFYAGLSTVKQKDRQRQRYRVLHQGMKYVAGFLIIVILSIGLLSAGIEGFREKIVNLVIHETSEYTEYKMSTDDQGLPSLADHVYSIETVPDGYALVKDEEIGSMRILTYETEDKDEIRIQISKVEGSLGAQLDTEDAVVTPFEVEGFIADKIQKNGHTMIAMYNDYHFIVVMGQDQDEAVEAFAKGLH